MDYYNNMFAGLCCYTKSSVTIFGGKSNDITVAHFTLLTLTNSIHGQKDLPICEKTPFSNDIYYMQGSLAVQ